MERKRKKGMKFFEWYARKKILEKKGNGKYIRF